jgi:hypothetical protein
MGKGQVRGVRREEGRADPLIPQEGWKVRERSAGGNLRLFLSLIALYY